MSPILAKIDRYSVSIFGSLFIAARSRTGITKLLRHSPRSRLDRAPSRARAIRFRASSVTGRELRTRHQTIHLPVPVRGAGPENDRRWPPRGSRGPGQWRQRSSRQINRRDDDQRHQTIATCMQRRGEVRFALVGPCSIGALITCDCNETPVPLRLWDAAADTAAASGPAGQYPPHCASLILSHARLRASGIIIDVDLSLTSTTSTKCWRNIGAILAISSGIITNN